MSGPKERYEIELPHVVGSASVVDGRLVTLVLSQGHTALDHQQARVTDTCKERVKYRKPSVVQYHRTSVTVQGRVEHARLGPGSSRVAVVNGLPSLAQDAHVVKIIRVHIALERCKKRFDMSETQSGEQ